MEIIEILESIQIVVLAIAIILVGAGLVILGLLENENLAIGLGIVFIVLGLSSVPLMMIMDNCQDNSSRHKATPKNEIIQQVEYEANVHDGENEILYKYYYK